MPASSLGLRAEGAPGRPRPAVGLESCGSTRGRTRCSEGERDRRRSLTCELASHFPPRLSGPPQSPSQAPELSPSRRREAERPWKDTPCSPCDREFPHPRHSRSPSPLTDYCQWPSVAWGICPTASASRRLCLVWLLPCRTLASSSTFSTPAKLESSPFQHAPWQGLGPCLLLWL